MTEKSEEYVHAMIAKAAEAVNSTDALKFSQSAANAANALCALQTYKIQQK